MKNWRRRSKIYRTAYDKRLSAPLVTQWALKDPATLFPARNRLPCFKCTNVGTARLCLDVDTPRLGFDFSFFTEFVKCVAQLTGFQTCFAFQGGDGCAVTAFADNI